MDKHKILLFGGTFNPIHNGHLIISMCAAEAIRADKVCIIPNGIPPHKDSVLSLHHKVEMLKLAIENDKFFEINRYEIEKTTPSYTLETVRFIKMCMGDTIDKPYVLIGPDNLPDLINWYKIEELVKECIFVVGSPDGIDVAIWDMVRRWPFYPDLDELFIAPIPQIDIRSRNIRKRISEGLSIKYFVPETVERYIAKHGLYSDNK